MPVSEVRIVLDKFPLANDAIRRGASKAVRGLAFILQEQVIHNIGEVNAIDTGALRNSIYVETHESNGRAAALAKAIAIAGTPGAHSGMPHEVHEAVPGSPVEGELSARVAACVEYALYVEMGVVGSAYGDQPARPFMTPAAETVKAKAEKIASEYVKDEVNKIV